MKRLCKDDKISITNVSNVHIMFMSGELIGVKDLNGNCIFIGSVIEHSNNLYVIKFSKNRKEIVARKEPLKGHKSSWRDLCWIKRCSPYIKMVGTVIFDEEMAKRFKGVY